MDSRSTTTNRCGSPRSFGITGAAFLFLVVGWSTRPGHADQPPSIRASGQSQILQVLEPFHPAIFPEQSWHFVAPKPFGATVAVWSIEAFQNTHDPNPRVDAQLNLRILDHGHSGAWQVMVHQDRTDFQQGRTFAHVVAASGGGHGECGVTVSFLGQEQPFAADGVYEATVVGTITEAF